MGVGEHPDAEGVQDEQVDGGELAKPDGPAPVGVAAGQCASARLALHIKGNGPRVLDLALQNDGGLTLDPDLDAKSVTNDGDITVHGGALQFDGAEESVTQNSGTLTT